MPEQGRCETCRWWNYTGALGARFCQNDKVYRFCGRPPDWFGCIFHEPRPQTREEQFVEWLEMKQQKTTHCAADAHSMYESNYWIGESLGYGAALSKFKELFDVAD